jgi:hypothetical protein
MVKIRGYSVVIGAVEVSAAVQLLLAEATSVIYLFLHAVHT